LSINIVFIGLTHSDKETGFFTESAGHNASFRPSNPVSESPWIQDYFIHDEEPEGVHPNFVGYTAYSRFIKYTPETGFLYSSRIITDYVQETRFFCTKATWNMLYLQKWDTPARICLKLIGRGLKPSLQTRIHIVCSQEFFPNLKS
jgi:hypothetical protein